MHNPLQSQVLVQCKVAGDLLEVSHGGNQDVAIHGRKPVQECDGATVAPDDVMWGECGVALHQAAQETGTSKLPDMLPLMEANHRRLVEDAGIAQRLRHSEPVARSVAN